MIATKKVKVVRSTPESCRKALPERKGARLVPFVASDAPRQALLVQGLGVVHRLSLGGGSALAVQFFSPANRTGFFGALCSQRRSQSEGSPVLLNCKAGFANAVLSFQKDGGRFGRGLQLEVTPVANLPPSTPFQPEVFAYCSKPVPILHRHRIRGEAEQVQVSAETVEMLGTGSPRLPGPQVRLMLRH